MARLRKCYYRHATSIKTSGKITIGITMCPDLIWDYKDEYKVDIQIQSNIRLPKLKSNISSASTPLKITLLSSAARPRPAPFPARPRSPEHRELGSRRLEASFAPLTLTFWNSLPFCVLRHLKLRLVQKDDSSISLWCLCGSVCYCIPKIMEIIEYRFTVNVYGRVCVAVQ